MTDRARLAYFPGSPFARMARVLVDEWALPVDPVEWRFPPSEELFRLNPLGQVPALLLADGSARFPTLIVLETLWEMAGRPAAAYAPERDRQLLVTVLQAGDALAAAFYQGWAGLGPTGPNHVGYDPAARNLARLASVLRWLDGDGGPCRLAPGVTLPGTAIAALLLWADARGGFPWRAHRKLTAVVDGLAARPSFRATEPQPWSPGGDPPPPGRAARLIGTRPSRRPARRPP